MQSNRYNDAQRVRIKTKFPDADEALIKLAEVASQAAPLSIDYFLAKHPSFAAMGRLVIADEILHREKGQSLTNANPARDWFLYLWQQMLSGCDSAEDFGRNKVAFLTFNYDRSLEKLLLLRLSAMFGEVSGRDVLIDIVRNIPIIHLHGALGELPELALSAGPHVLDYGAAPADWDRIASRIGLVGEHDAESTEFKRAHALLAEAKQVFFLGFGFHAENVTNLKPNIWYREGVEISASAMGIKPAETQQWRTRLGQTPGKLGTQDCDALQFLRERANFLQ